MKYFGIKLTKDVKGLYTGNDKRVTRKIKEEPDKERDILCSWVKRLNILKISILLKMMYAFSAMPTINTFIFVKTDKQNSKIQTEIKRTYNSKNNVWNRMKSSETDKNIYKHI